MSKRSRLGIGGATCALFAGCVLAAWSCGDALEPRAANQPRLVLLYSTCTVSTRYLSPYQPGVRYTPHLERFGQLAKRLARHQTEAGQSGIAFASIYTGRQAMGHGIFAHPRELPSSVPLLAEAFRDAGYEVASWLLHPMASAELGYARGSKAMFDDSTNHLRPTNRDFVELLDRLEADPSRKALVITNFSVTHGPYYNYQVPLARFCNRYPQECTASRDRSRFEHYRALYVENALPLSFDHERAVARLGLDTSQQQELRAVVELLYKAGISYLDGAFGGVMAQIARRGLLPHSVIVFTADHGEVLYRDNALFMWTHGYQLAPEVLQVPFLVYAPGRGIKAGTYEGVTRSVDVFPTLAALADVSIPHYHGPGVDLSAALRGDEAPPRLLAFSHSSVLNEVLANQTRELRLLRSLYPTRDPERIWVAVRDGDLLYKLRRLDDEFRPALFDLARDPEERTDLYDAANPAHREMLDRLQKYRRSLIDAYASREEGAGPGVPDERQAELLRSLGYID